MTGILTKRLRKHIKNYGQLLRDIEFADGEKREKLMYERRYLDSRVKSQLEKANSLARKIVSEVNNDLNLLEKWNSEKNYHDLVREAKIHASKKVHQIKTSLKSRKHKLESFYETIRNVICPNCGYDMLIKDVAGDEGKIVSGVSTVIGISDPQPLLRSFRPSETWVDEQIEEKKFDKLKRLADYIMARLKEEGWTEAVSSD